MGLMDIRRRILADSPVLAEASGAVASFSTDMASPLKKCEFGIEPVQSGTGDPSPSNVRPISGWTGANISRTGANIWDEQWEVGGFNYTTGVKADADDRIRSKNQTPVRPSTSYYIKAPAGVQLKVLFYQADGTFIETWNDNSWAYGGAFTTPSNCGLVAFATGAVYGTTYNNDISINYPSTDTAYHAYTGNTYPVQFPATKNKCPVATGTDIKNKGVKPSGISSYEVVIDGLKPNTTYILQVTITATFEATTGRRLYFYATGDNGAGHFISMGAETAPQTKTITATTNGNGSLTITHNSTALNDADYAAALTNIQVEEGTTATPYEPYGTIYGGYIDPVRGVAVAEWGKWHLNKADITYNSYGFYQYTNVISGSVNTSTDLSAKCNKLKTASNVGGSTTGSQFSINGTNVRIAVDGLSKESGHIEDYQTALGDNVEVCAKLTTPIEYPLTPQLIKSLKGQNNVFSDLNGNTTVKYWKH